MRRFAFAVLLYIAVFGVPDFQVPSIPSLPFWPVGPSQPEDPKTPANLFVYVYDLREGGPVPIEVTKALHELNTRPGVKAQLYEIGTVDGDDEVPDQYKPAYEHSKTTGLPVLVAQAGDKVIKAVKDPRTTEAALEAAK